MAQPDVNLARWISSDAGLSDLLTEIRQMPVSVEVQAEETFHRVSDMYGLPKMPEDIVIDEDDTVEQDGAQEYTCVYEQLGLLKYLYPDGDPRDRVLAAIYTVKNNLAIDMEDVMQKKYGGSPPPYCGIGWMGDSSAVEIIFIEKP